MSHDDWPSLDRVVRAYFILTYAGAPNFGVAGIASGRTAETVATHVDAAGMPRKKHTRNGVMGPAPEELWRLVDLAEGMLPGPAVNAATGVASANAPPDSVAISVPLEGDVSAMEKLKGLHPNLEITVAGRLRVEG